MFSRLKQRLRAWLLDDPDPEQPSPILKCVIRDKVTGTRLVDCHIDGAVGMRLSGRLIGAGRGESVRLIGAPQAVDGDHFWELWRSYNRDVKLSWEDSDD